MKEVRHLPYLLLIVMLVSTWAPASMAYAQQQTGVIGARATFVVHIPAKAYIQGNVHYDPLHISVPTGTTVEFTNDDPNQVHTVTSGLPGSTDAGKLFDSGVMAEGAAFQHTFDKAGEYAYFCKLHPWMAGSVSVSGTYVQGRNLKLSMGTGAVFDFNKSNRTLLAFEPTSMTFRQDEPVTYKITILKNDKEVFSKDFSILADKLPIELVPSDSATSVYGPDSNEPVTGAYHIQGSFLKDNAAYKIRAEITHAGGKALDKQIGDEFGMQIVPEFPIPVLGAVAAVVVGIVAVLSRTRMFIKIFWVDPASSLFSSLIFS
jgi:plastocyanin